MPRHVFLVRHCQSQANAEGRIEGCGDSPLSPLGHEQARSIGALMAERELANTRLIASNQARAMATAAAIGEACGWEVSHHDHRIREGDLGWMENITYAEVARHMAERQTRELDSHIHGGESLQTVGQRSWEALSEALAAHDGVVVLVSHGYTIQALLRRLDPDVTVPRFISNGDAVEVWLDGEAFAEPPRHWPLSPQPA